MQGLLCVDSSLLSSSEACPGRFQVLLCCLQLQAHVVQLLVHLLGRVRRLTAALLGLVPLQGLIPEQGLVSLQGLIPHPLILHARQPKGQCSGPEAVHVSKASGLVQDKGQGGASSSRRMCMLKSCSQGGWGLPVEQLH